MVSSLPHNILIKMQRDWDHTADVIQAAFDPLSAVACTEVVHFDCLLSIIS